MRGIRVLLRAGRFRIQPAHPVFGSRFCLQQYNCRMRSRHGMILRTTHRQPDRCRCVKFRRRRIHQLQASELPRGKRNRPQSPDRQALQQTHPERDHRFRLHSDPRPCRRRRLTKSNTCRLRLVVHRRARNPLQACIPQIRAFGSLQRQKPKDKLSSGAPSSSLAQLQRFRRKGFRPESFWAQRQGTIVQRFRSPRQVTEMLLP